MERPRLAGQTAAAMPKSALKIAKWIRSSKVFAGVASFLSALPLRAPSLSPAEKVGPFGLATGRQASTGTTS